MVAMKEIVGLADTLNKCAKSVSIWILRKRGREKNLALTEKTNPA
jgi:hypothetical protein